MAERDDIELKVRIVPKGENGTVRLAVDFDGAQPPNQFFADLDMIGWQVAAMPPPPREAIDWSRPNTETGQRFSLSSWQVVGFVVDPPPGSARGGGWSNDETRPFMAALNGVLRRHGFGGERAAPPAESVPAPSADTAADQGASRGTSGTGLIGAGLRRGATTGMPILESIGVPEGLDPVRLVADISNIEVFDRIELALSTIAVHARLTIVHRTRTESYRASTYERHDEVAVIDMTIPRSTVVAVIAILREFGTTPAYDTTRFIEFDQSFAAAPTAPTPILSAVHEAEGRESTTATITLLIDPPRRILVEDELDGLPIEHVEWSKSERIVEETFRGSSYERTVATLLLKVQVAPDDVRTVAPTLADAAGVLLDDPTRFELHLPSRPESESETETESGEVDTPTGTLRTA